MLIQTGYKFRTYSTDAQRRVFGQWFGCRRFVKNQCKRVRMDAWTQRQERLSGSDLIKMLPAWKAEFPWLKDVPNQILQQAVLDSDKAFENFFRTATAAKGRKFGFPDWSRKYEDDSARFPAVSQRQRLYDPKTGEAIKDETGEDLWRETEIITLGEEWIDLPKIGKVRWCRHRKLDGTPKSVTIVCDGGQITVSVMVEKAIPDPVFDRPPVHLLLPDGSRRPGTEHLWSPSRPATGIDVGGLIHYADAHGAFFNLPGWSKGEERRKLSLEHGIARKVRAREAFEADLRQRGLMKDTEFLPRSKREEESRAALAALHGRIKRGNQDSLHKHTTGQTKNHGLIGVEDLRVQAMTASAKGTVEDPGKNVAAKAGMNRGFLGASPRTARTFLEYKGARGFEQTLPDGRSVRLGCLVVPVPAAYTSQTCSRCRRHPRDLLALPAAEKAALPEPERSLVLRWDAERAAAEAAGEDWEMPNGRQDRDRFVCPLCGHAEHADTNAAKNILYGAQVLAGWLCDPVCLALLRKLGAKTLVEREREAAAKVRKLHERQAKMAAAKAVTMQRKRQDKIERLRIERLQGDEEEHRMAPPGAVPGDRNGLPF